MANDTATMCGLNKKQCGVSVCHVNSDGTYNGLCCEQSLFNDFLFRSCHCFTGFAGEFCERTNHDEMLSALASIKDMSDKSAINVTIFGVFLGVMALTLSAIVLFVVIRMSRKKKVVVMEEAAEPTSPQGTNAPSERPENVFVVRRGNSVMRYSSHASSCCHHPTDPNCGDTSQLPLSPTPSATQCTSPPVDTKHDNQAPPSQSHQDEIDGAKCSTHPDVKNNSNEYIVAMDETIG